MYGIKGEFMARDDFTEATKKLLAKRVGYICSNPFCRRVTVGPQIGGEKTVNIHTYVQLLQVEKDMIRK